MDIDSILKKAQILHENNQEFFDNIVPLMDGLTTLLGENIKRITKEMALSEVTQEELEGLPED